MQRDKIKGNWDCAAIPNTSENRISRTDFSVLRDSFVIPQFIIAYSIVRVLKIFLFMKRRIK